MEFELFQGDLEATGRPIRGVGRMLLGAKHDAVAHSNPKKQEASEEHVQLEMKKLKRLLEGLQTCYSQHSALVSHGEMDRQFATMYDHSMDVIGQLMGRRLEHSALWTNKQANQNQMLHLTGAEAQQHKLRHGLDDARGDARDAAHKNALSRVEQELARLIGVRQGIPFKMEPYPKAVSNRSVDDSTTLGLDMVLMNNRVKSLAEILAAGHG
eukprot:CAMPEP_0114292004 /NCGR_PEP_ID=MMETSP0059-20121206/8817_1 /TAXON_ID=36894 /ORGANISM="Pyramimonas parkeae, Strain CCMP726" /LENGTH=211 /DNA_ID=CAMNT_0001413597 /DNA_START=820 /DNA_END=1456 /DNA_ORIENTATION=-